MSGVAAELVDGYGASRVASEVIARLLVVREVVESDSRDIWEWRHEGGAARFYLSGKETPYEEHLAWLRGAIGAPGRFLLMVEKGAESIGHIRLDLNGKEVREATVSISISPRIRGKRLAQAILIAGMNFAADRGFTKLNAAVHSDNVASHRLFLSCGFCEAGHDQDFILLAKKIVRTDVAINGANGE
nr:GNAT family N-acetyltransferase [Qipengyuania huizhouensis]